MSLFQRRIYFDHLKNLGCGAPDWLDDLFRLWAPAGSPAESPARIGASTPLRFAIRDGYANFYASGQSIAKVKMGPKVLSAEVHEKYFENDPEKRKSLSQKSRRLSGNLSSGSVGELIAVAGSYAGAEKKFVEQLVAANPNVIDMEMALPALPELRSETDKKSAVRMDLVALEPWQGGWRLVFWEAKMVDNPEARAKGDRVPQIVDQREKYRNWLKTPGNKKLVLDAYAAVCRDLVRVHQLVRKSGLGDGLPELGDGICAVAGGAALDLDDEIRLIIGPREGKTDASFEANGHLEKLERKHGMFVQMVRTTDDPLQLRERSE